MKSVDDYATLKEVKANMEKELKAINKELKAMQDQITETFNNEGILKAACTEPGVQVGLVKTTYANIEDKVEFKKYLIGNNLADSFLEEKIIKKQADGLVRDIHKKAFIDGQRPQFPPGLSSYTVMTLRVYRESSTRKFNRAGKTLMEKIRLGEWE